MVESSWRRLSVLMIAVAVVLIAALYSISLLQRWNTVETTTTTIEQTTMVGASTTDASYGATTTTKTTPPQNHIELCKKDKEFSDSIRLSAECIGRDFKCIDGWGVTVYYDKRLAATTEFKPSLHIPEELKDAVIAEYGNSVCNCKTPISYQILSEGQLKETECENFYGFIEDYNSSCNNCVLTWETGCC